MFDNMIHIAKIEFAQPLNTLEISTDIYISGCKRSPHCFDCHNPSLWEQKPEQLMSFDDVITNLKRDKLSTVICFLGGEPLDSDNLEELLTLIKKEIKKKIMVYTGRTIDQVPNFMFKLCDIMKTGPYMKRLQEPQQDKVYPSLASENQQIWKKIKNKYWYLIYPEPRSCFDEIL